MAVADRLVYPASPAWRGPEKALLNAVVTLFAAGFAALGIVAIVGGGVSGSGGAVIFGILWTAVLGYIMWTYLHLASRLEFSAGCLSWRCSLPWTPAMRPGRIRAIRWPASSRSRYVGIELADGRKLSVLPRPGLMEFIDGVRAAEPAIIVDLYSAGRASAWMSPERAGYIGQRVAAVSGHRSLQVAFSIVVALVLLGVVAEMGLTLIGPQENFQTLRGDLAKVHLPPRYRLITTRQAGSDCAHAECSLTQTWSWTPAANAPVPPPAATSTTPWHQPSPAWTPTLRCPPAQPVTTTQSWETCSTPDRENARSKPSSGLASPPQAMASLSD